ncbi:ABC transporter substrate-binding protein [Paenibacillus allorhizosphaerae]|uniref:Extracellular solute-binding protein n=1 Tax=Paenibacillus allorhizosphaerae TaxID=2849866 RepID=A0ABM8VH31_9BACL|nr:extracellular solute-binding protein [Paenibacillus allorhizosphaerae]CAG7640500.1 hypothetical protein PAECIP111802_02654 [Paenibacillus allorhizosphaerae]
MRKTVPTLLTMLLIVSGCSGQTGNVSNTQAEKEVVDSKPVTLKLYNYGALNEEMYQRLFVEPVKKKYPHITLEKIERAKVPPEQIAVNGLELDIITGWGSLLDQFADHKLLADMTPVIKKHNIDLNRIDTANLEGVKLQSGTISPGGLYALPFGYNFYALFYNKNIFDKFGVAYPPDGMTWDDAVALGRKLTRNVDGIQYKGLDPEGVEKVSNSLSLPYVDPVTMKASLNNDGWKKVFQLLKTINDIPGNEFKITNHSGTVNRFMKDKNVAMLAAPEVLNSLVNLDFDWDLAEYPFFQERPHTSGMLQTFVLQLGSNSKQPDAAMQVIQLALSDEVQMTLSKSGNMLSVLKDQTIQKSFGMEHPLLKNKHIEAILKTKAAPYVIQTRFTTKTRNILELKYRDFAEGKKDVNTALREAQEEAEAYIASEKKN